VECGRVPPNFALTSRAEAASLEQLMSAGQRVVAGTGLHQVDKTAR